MIRRSRIFSGKVVHERLSPCKHKFTYPMTFFAFDLEELPNINREVTLFGYNKPRALQLNDCDYLYGRSEPILDQLNRLLPPQQDGQNSLLISSPRYFGYAFNPVNFHLRMYGNQLLSAVSEVNNTFGDRHVYPLKKLKQTDNCTWTACSSKDFHVSPFNNLSGIYHFKFRITDNMIYLGVNLYRDNICVLKTWMEGKGRPLSNNSILKYALMHPFSTALNSMPRILWQAAVLYYLKRMRVYSRPPPVSRNTLVNRDLK